MNPVEQAYVAGIQHGYMSKQAAESELERQLAFQNFVNYQMAKEAGAGSALVEGGAKAGKGAAALAKKLLGLIKKAPGAAKTGAKATLGNIKAHPWKWGLGGAALSGAGAYGIHQLMAASQATGIPMDVLIGAGVGAPIGGAGGYLASDALGINPWLGAGIGTLAGAGLGAGGGALYDKYMA